MLLQESQSQIETIVESTSVGKNVYLEGIFAQSEKKNRNGRIYPRSVLERAVRKYNDEYVQTGKALGELNHPARTEVALEEAAIIIESLKWDGNNVIGKAKVLNTPKGNILKGLLEGGYQAGVSTRGTGSIVNESGVSIVQDDFTLTAIDFVDRPSAHDATPSTIVEAEQKRQDALKELLTLIKNV